MNYQVVADESVDFRIVIRLREIDFTVYSIAEEAPSITDKSVLTIAFKNRALLITEDKDFGELVFRLQLPHYGVLLIRIEEVNYKIFSVTAAIKQYYDEMINKFSVINNSKLRIKE
jgi:predicted nuclease of predicted toxin-antitoxin system